MFNNINENMNKMNELIMRVFATIRLYLFYPIFLQ